MKHGQELIVWLSGIVIEGTHLVDAPGLAPLLEELDQRLQKLEGRFHEDRADVVKMIEELEHRVTCMDGGPESSDEELPRKPLSEEEPKPFREGGPRGAQHPYHWEPWYTQRHVDALEQEKRLQAGIIKGLQEALDEVRGYAPNTLDVLALRSRLAQAEKLLAKVTDFATGGHPDDIADFLKNTPLAP